MSSLRSVLLLFTLCISTFTVYGEERDEQFTEALLLRPLPDRKVLSHFHFQSSVPHSYGTHHRLFPKAIYQLAKKFRVKEMELSFTQGRWNYKSWGGYDPISSENSKPPGVELWAVFDVPQDQVDSTWKNLTHTLSGLFCASINFLESSTTYSAPDLTFQQLYSGNLRYGTLPREAVCTENLTPWLKLLPCRDKSGISALMDRPSLYRGFYHSQRLHLTSNLNNGLILDQTLTVVLQPHMGPSLFLQPIWSIRSLFDRKLGGKCVLANSSNVYVHIEGTLASEVKTNPGFELSVQPHRAFQENKEVDPSILYEYSIENYSDSEPFDLEFQWNSRLVWSCSQAPLHASRFLMGSGNERGSVAISLESSGSSSNILRMYEDSPHQKCWLRVNIFQVVPWYVKVYYHTLQVFVDEQPRSLDDVIEKMRVSPSEDKVSTGVMEILLKLPCDVKLATLTLEFDKGFLHIDEYPPDANQGFDIPSAVISFPDFQASMDFLVDPSSSKSSIISKLQEKSTIMSYTEILLVPLTTPDFSMPYNVITITCTIFALYFGSLLNALRRRVGEEERLLKNRAATKTGKLSKLLGKLIAKLRGKKYDPPPASTAPSSSSSSSFFRSKLFLKIILVAIVAVVWQFYVS